MTIWCRLFPFNLDFVTNDKELLEGGPTEIRRERHIGGIASDSHNDTADARDVVPSIESIPAVAQIGLEPAAEVHWKNERHTDVSHVPNDVKGRGVYSAQKKKNRKRGKKEDHQR